MTNLVMLVVIGLISDFSLGWVAIFLLALAYLTLAYICGPYLVATLHMKAFFKEYIDPKSGKFCWPPQSGCQFEHINCEGWVPRKRFDGMHMFDFGKFDASAHKTVEDFINSETPVSIWMPFRAFRAVFADGPRPSRAAAFNASSRMIIVVGEDFEESDPYHLLILFHELYHTSEDGELQLKLLSCELLGNIGALALMVTLASSWWQWIIALAFSLFTVFSYKTMKTYREVMADTDAVAGVLKKCPSEQSALAILDLHKMWVRSLRMKKWYNINFERSIRIENIERCISSIKQAGRIPYNDPQWVPSRSVLSMIFWGFLFAHFVTYAAPISYISFATFAIAVGLLILVYIVIYMRNGSFPGVDEFLEIVEQNPKRTKIET